MELNFTGTGVDQTITFQLGIAPQLLFVADFEEANDGEFDFSSIYRDDFSDRNIAFDYVHRINTEITYEMLSDYKIVVWACEWNFPSLTASDRAAIAQYLDNGGSLFTSGQDIGWELNESGDNVDVDFFENYLKASYIADDAGESSIFGIDGDPISNGITETPIFQIRRASSSQYPDEIEGLDGAVPVFNYNKGTAGAIRYDGDYQLVYFGFGGYEALTDDDDRRLIMKRIINWFSGIDYDLEDVMDTEETETDIDVTLTVNTETTLNTVRLFYDTDGEVPYESIDMTNDGGGVYTATIPGQPEGTDVMYFANIVAAGGDNVLTESKSFYVGADLVAPQVNVVSNPLRNSINRYGIDPYELTAEFTDNFAIDPAEALLNYWVNDESLNSEVLTNIGDDLYSGSFSFEQPLNFGDQVSYYFSASDVSSNANTTVSDTVTYTIDSTQVVDDFELPFFDWTGDANWGLSTTSKTGSYSLSDSPIGSYENNSNTWVMYNMPFDLSLYKAGEISYQLRTQLSSSADSLLFEISSDGGSSWTTLDAVTQNFIFFTKRTVDISEYTGAEFNDVRIRFRLSTDSDGNADGVYIDDVVISVSPDGASSVEAGDQIPKTFELSQNYPNPFNPSTTIKFGLPVNADVNISVYNILGQVVEVLADERMNAGSYSVSFDSKNTLSSGIYFYRINAQGIDGKNFVDTKKMILIK
ncbi:MAG: T9SS type A sorting domain-containing protein [Melioribacteraceae bacterium]|nr:T9SS type A sorting domain-containing protein [Melioribacteraceae bacterium]